MDGFIEKIRNAGIVGAGGAGFPTYAKYNAKVDTVIANGAECEPLLFTDQYIMVNHADEIVKALYEVGKYVKAKHLFIAIKAKHRECIDKIESSIKKFSYDIDVFQLDDVYPVGDEFVLVRDVTGKVIQPGRIPLNVGTLVTNVGTLLNVYNALFNNLPVVDKYITVTGNVKKACVIKVPIGTSIGECINLAGGMTIDDYSIILGGPMMGQVYRDGASALDLPVTKTSGGIIVLPSDHKLILDRTRDFRTAIKLARSSCIQCQICSEMCPRHLLGHNLYPHKIMRGLSNVDSCVDFSQALICSECNICELYACPMGITPRTANVNMKDILRKNNIKYIAKNNETIENPMRESRRVPVSRLIERIGVSKYVKEIDYNDVNYTPKIVKILLKQHIGVAAKPCVKKGDYVDKNSLIADVENDALGAPIHASISGIVEDILDTYIVIKGEGRA